MILKNTITHTGALATVHILFAVQIRHPLDEARVEVRSYASEEAYIAGYGNLNSEQMTVPLVQATWPVGEYIEQHLATDSASPFVGGTVVPDTGMGLEVRKARKTAEFNAYCTTQITNGFTSSALGAPHHYPAKKQDQDNLVASVADSLIPGAPEDWVTPFWCEATGGAWAMRPHTAPQIQQVGREAKVWVLGALMKNEGLRQQVADATTEQQLDDINW